MKYITAPLLVFFVLGLSIPSAFGEYVPDWVKNTAGWWATDAISEIEFVNAIEFLVNENIIQVSVIQTSETSQGVPDWVKNTAGWWATDAISEIEFVNAIAYLIKNGIISIESSKSPELIAEMWINGDINDDEFLASIENKIESSNIAKSSQLPDWLVNNAGWWAARIITDSDFNFDPGYVKEKIYPCDDHTGTTVCIERTYNSHEFRGDEFEKEKPDDVFRIFAVGGSTTFGTGAADDETYPVYLQQIIDEKNPNKKIEVINFGVPGADTDDEYSLIENNVISLNPDLIIMFDGWNDFQNSVQVEKTIQNWKSVCELGKNEGFDTIIVVQAINVPTHRVLTEQEIMHLDHWNQHVFQHSNLPYLQISQQYVDAFEELDNVCTKTADLRRVFDYVQEPIFYDHGHMMSFANKIIAKNIFSVISPIYFGETYSVTQDDLPGTSVVYAVGANLSGKNFDNLNLQNAVFDKADLSNTSFKNANIDGARFVFANLDNSNLLDRTDLSNINLAGVDLSNTSIKGKDLSGANLSYVDLSNTSIKGKDLSGANLSYVDLSEHDLTGTNLIGATMINTKLSNTSIKGKDLSGANLSYVDLSEHDLTGTNLSDTFLIEANLTGIDLRSTTLTNADLRYAHLSESKLLDLLLVNNKFDYAKLNGIDFSGKDLSGSSFIKVNLEGSDMQNTNLSNADFVEVDLTKIKNKSLAGADLTDASFAYSNLSGVNMADVILNTINFWHTKLPGVDFTVADVIDDGLLFVDSDLSNSNFEGVNLAPKLQYSNTFENKAYLIGDLTQSSENELKIRNELFGVDDNIPLLLLIFSAEVDGNDLTVNYGFRNNFGLANLENANFKNADLRFVDFYSASLVNADLSGADLTNAILLDADLEGAILDDAILSNANLKCINHPICLNE